MMFKFVVLVGFVACAVAVPTPEEAAPVRQTRETYNECVQRCGIELGKPQIPGRGECFVLCFPYKRSLADVVPSEQMKRAIDVKIEASSLPIDSEVAPVRRARDGYMDCVTDCALRMGGPMNPGAAACFAICAFKRSMTDVVPSEQMKRMVDFTRPELVGGAPVEVKQCFNKCVADYGASGDNFNYCIIGCNLGGQKLVEKEGVVPTGGRQARGIDSCMSGYCYYVALIPPALGPCMLVCMAAGGRRRSIPKDEMIPAIDVDFKPQLRYSKEECTRSCFPGPTYLFCLNRCNQKGRSLAGASSLPTDSEVAPVRKARAGYMDCDCSNWKPSGSACLVFCALHGRSLKDDSFAVDGKREARATRAQCELNCFIEGPFYYAACISDRCRGLHRSLGDNADPMLAGASSLPIDSATLMQITEPIANILSQVIMKQQELEKMVQSCNCAKPLTPFGLDNGTLGPYF